MSFNYDPDFINVSVLYSYPDNPLKLYSGFSQSRQREVVYKVMECTPETGYLVDYVRKEAAIAQRARSPNICEVYECKDVHALGESGEEKRFLCIVMEKLKMDWFDEIESRRKKASPYPENLLWERLYVLGATLAALQKMDLAHRDIKPHNIFLTTDGHVKLGDFGSSREIGEAGRNALTVQGTPIYLSPKVMQAHATNNQRVQHDVYKSDVYSLGMTFVHAANLQINPEWMDQGISEMRNQQIIGELKYSENLKRLLMAMIAVEESQRPDFLMLVQWLGIAPNLTSSVPQANILVYCPVCYRECSNVPFLHLPCGHVLSFCQLSCLEEYAMKHGQNPVICCINCKMETSSEIIKANFPAMVSLFPKPIPQLIPDDSQPSETLQISGVCSSCRRSEMLFQVCHPICFDCLFSVVSAQAKSDQKFGCEICSVEYPKDVLDMILGNTDGA